LEQSGGIGEQSCKIPVHTFRTLVQTYWQSGTDSVISGTTDWHPLFGETDGRTRETDREEYGTNLSKGETICTREKIFIDDGNKFYGKWNKKWKLWNLQRMLCLIEMLAQDIIELAFFNRKKGIEDNM
jgi:hypothetical protein